jgi:anti-sigma factor (TIGR02949 family)
MINFVKQVANKLFGGVSGKRYCCKDFITKLDLVLDGESTKEDIEYLQKHINQCAPCYDHYNLEKSIKEVIKHKIAQRPVPSCLIDNIRNNIKNNCE